MTHSALPQAGTVTRTRLAIATKETAAAAPAEACTEAEAAELHPAHGPGEALGRKQEQGSAVQSEQMHQQEAHAASAAADVKQPGKVQPAAGDADNGAQAAQRSTGADLPAQPETTQELGEIRAEEADQPAALPQQATDTAELAGAATSLGTNHVDNDDEEIEVDVEEEQFQEAADVFETPAHQPRFMTPGSSFGTARQQPTAYKTGQEYLTGTHLLGAPCSVPQQGLCRRKQEGVSTKLFTRTWHSGSRA